MLDIPGRSACSSRLRLTGSHVTSPRPDRDPSCTENEPSGPDRLHKVGEYYADQGEQRRRDYERHARPARQPPRADHGYPEEDEADVQKQKPDQSRGSEGYAIDVVLHRHRLGGLTRDEQTTDRRLGERRRSKYRGHHRVSKNGRDKSPDHWRA